MKRSGKQKRLRFTIMSFTINLSPNFNKLKFYFRDKSQEEITNATNNGVSLQYDFIDEIEFNRISNGLLPIFERYQLTEHYNELLYLILRGMAATDEKYNLLIDIYNEKMKVREVAQFLLTIKELKSNDNLQLVLKPSTSSSAAIKNNAIARWMAELIYEQIEKKNFTMEVFGSQLYTLFDVGGNVDFNAPIDLSKLEALANSRPKNPKPMLKKYNYLSCLSMQPFLDEHTLLKLPDDVKLTDAQANFFFDVLEHIGYINRDNINSEPKDYMHALFANNS